MKALEIYDNTLIVLTSDHGEYFGEHLLVEHSKDIYMEATHVPLIIKYPGQLEGSVSDLVISSVDIPGMILDQLPAEVAKPYLDRFPARPGNHPVLIENYYTRTGDLWNRRWGHRFRRVRRAIIDWPYKVIRSSDGAHELYDLSVDIAESNNLYATKTDVANRLFSLEQALGTPLQARPPCDHRLAVQGHPFVGWGPRAVRSQRRYRREQQPLRNRGRPGQPTVRQADRIPKHSPEGRRPGQTRAVQPRRDRATQGARVWRGGRSRGPEPRARRERGTAPTRDPEGCTAGTISPNSASTE